MIKKIKLHQKIKGGRGNQAIGFMNHDILYNSLVLLPDNHV